MTPEPKIERRNEMTATRERSHGIITITVAVTGVPDRPTPYSHAGQIYRPASVRVDFAIQDDGELTLHAVKIYGRRVVKSGDVNAERKDESVWLHGSPAALPEGIDEWVRAVVEDARTGAVALLTLAAEKAVR